jgi:hypothetical protein
LREHQEISDCLTDIFSGGDNKQLALVVLEYWLKAGLHLDENIRKDILAKCGSPITDPESLGDVVDDLMGAVESFVGNREPSKLVEIFSKYSKRTPPTLKP